MKKTVIAVGVIILCFVLTINLSLKAEDMKTNINKKDTAIILAAFGTSYTNAQKALFDIEKISKKQFPNTKIVMTFSSNIIRKILAQRGQHFDSPAEAVKQLKKEGYKRIIIQSLQVIPGFEYDILIELKGKHKNVTVGQPLLSSYDAMMKVLKIVVNEAPKSRKPGEAVILVGHGTSHPADLSYVAAASELMKIDKNAFLCNVEGHLGFKNVVEECKKAGVKKAYIIPFMVVAGDHAHNDMFGDEPESLKSLLKAQGIQSEMVMKGMGENKKIAMIWIEHLQKAFNSGSDS